MDNSNVADLQSQTVEQITGQLPTLDRAALVELQAAETASPNPRTTLLAAIDSALQALDDDGGEGDKNPSAVGDAAGKPAAQAAGKLGKAHWQHPEYHGPLTGDQAAWRLANAASTDAAKDAPAPNAKPARAARAK
ncbi:hypothetical protein [Dyella sp.]|uniref:hypothetical protein n=1 Tax=Dyella sp. TaxID=1869338 RepID=UPI003F806313